MISCYIPVALWFEPRLFAVAEFDSSSCYTLRCFYCCFCCFCFCCIRSINVTANIHIDSVDAGKTGAAMRE